MYLIYIDKITNADKGGAVVIQDTEDYIKEANRQLSDTTFYKKHQIDLTSILYIFIHIVEDKNTVCCHDISTVKSLSI